jgi:hypothetical protein
MTGLPAFAKPALPLSNSRKHVNFPREMIAMSLQRPVIPTRQLNHRGEKTIPFPRTRVAGSHSIPEIILYFTHPWRNYCQSSLCFATRRLVKFFVNKHCFICYGDSSPKIL